MVAVLGTNHTALRRVSTTNRGKDSKDLFTLTYGFGGEESVMIQGWVNENTDPLGGAFDKALGLIRGLPAAKTQANSTGEGQPKD